jgi:hypothetical protein
MNTKITRVMCIFTKGLLPWHPSTSFTMFLPTSKNMVNVLANLNTTLCYDFIQDQTNILLLVSILSNSSKDENQHANIHVVSDDDESN